MKQKEAIDDTDRLLLNDIINELNEKRYGLVWEQHSEAIDDMMVNNIPVFTEDKDKKIVSDPDLPYNFLLEGDNLHSLKLLEKTHKGKIDVIYIDPPYNTGNKDFTYNDSFVGEDDGYRHSKWLSFMKERLDIAYDLLSKDGLIFISIDEFEFAQLKVLIDTTTTFSQYNFVENFIWIKNSTKNNSKTTSTNHEYILCYAKNIDVIKSNPIIFQTKKEGYSEVISFVEQCKKNEMSVQDTQAELRKMLKEHSEWKGISNYTLLDENYDVFRIDNISAPNGKGPHYDVLHPITKKPCKTPAPGWRFTRESMNELLANNLVYFGKDESIVPQYKRYLKTVKTEVVKSIIVDNTDGKKELMRIFNVATPDFTNPKPTTLIKTLLRFINKTDITILDFFAGSGTTGQAVMDLNMEDGGSRKFILCTNNENNICEDVTYQRLKTVITGIRKDGSKYSDGIPANLKYYKTDFVSKISKDDDYFIEDKLTQHIKEMIELENAVEIDNDKYILLLTDEEADTFEQEMKDKNVKKVYIDSTIMLSGKAQSYLDSKQVEVIPIPDYYFYKDINAG